MSTLFDTIKSGKRDEVRAALDRDPGLASMRDEAGLSPTLTALYHGHAELARDIASRVRELDVFEAAALGDDARLRTLLARDRALANAYNVDGFTPLGLAAFFKRGNVVRMLLDAGADPNAPSRNAFRFTPLHSAVSTDAGPVDTGIVHDLLDAGANVNARSGQGTTPLHTAAFTGDARVALLLIDHGADHKISSAKGQTPSDVARERKNNEVAEMLEALG